MPDLTTPTSSRSSPQVAWLPVGPEDVWAPALETRRVGRTEKGIVIEIGLEAVTQMRSSFYEDAQNFRRQSMGPPKPG